MRARFTIANLLLLTALIAMGLGWYLDHKQLSDRYNANTSTLRKVINDQFPVNYGLLKVAGDTVWTYKQYGPQHTVTFHELNDQLFAQTQQELLKKVSDQTAEAKLATVLWMGFHTAEYMRQTAENNISRLSRVEVK